MEPDIIPSPKRERRVAMMPGEFFGEIRSLETRASLRDAGNAEIFNENMWGEQHQSAHAVVGSCIDKSNGAAIAVADEDGIVDVELREEIGQRVQGLVVHITNGARLGEERGASATVA